MKQHGDTVAGKKIEIIRKDTGGIAPDVAKRLAQELVVRDKVDILGGLRADAERAGGRRRLGRGQEVHGGHERRDLDHHDEVALHGAHLADHCRSSTTPLGAWAYKKGGIRRSTRWCRTTARATTPSRPSSEAFKEAGGEIVGSVRMPVANPDFSAFVQRAKDLNPEAHLHLRSGRRAAGRDRQGVRRARHRPAEDQDHGHRASWPTSRRCKSMGDAALGIITALPLRLQPQVRRRTRTS